MRGFLNKLANHGFYKSRKIRDHVYNYVNLWNKFMCYELHRMLMLCTEQ